MTTSVRRFGPSQRLVLRLKTDESITMTTRPLRFGVMAALPQELGDLQSRMTQVQTTVLAKRQYLSGRLGQLDLVTVTSRVGKVAAASTATTLIQHFGAEAVVFVGVAGGLSEQVKVGDVVVADALLQHDLSAEPLFAKHEIPLLEISRLPCNERLSRHLRAAAQASLEGLNAPKHLDAQRPSQLHRGLVISGDRFINDVQLAQSLLSQTPDALAAEMEGAAVAQVCWEHGLPFGLVRTISDRCDAQAHTDFNAFIESVAAPMSSDILRHFFDRIVADELSVGGEQA
jgi:adenosylhomocysteine nucleosidase